MQQNTSAVDNAAPTNIKAGVTRFGKSIEIRRRLLGKFEIVVTGGGKQPPEFAGVWSFPEARLAVQGYMAKNVAPSVADVAEDLGVTEAELKAVLEPAAPAVDEYDNPPPDLEKEPAAEPAQEKKTLSLKRK